MDQAQPEPDNVVKTAEPATKRRRTDGGGVLDDPAILECYAALDLDGNLPPDMEEESMTKPAPKINEENWNDIEFYRQMTAIYFEAERDMDKSRKCVKSRTYFRILADIPDHPTKTAEQRVNDYAVFMGLSDAWLKIKGRQLWLSNPGSKHADTAVALKAELDESIGGRLGRLRYRFDGEVLTRTGQLQRSLKEVGRQQPAGLASAPKVPHREADFQYLLTKSGSGATATLVAEVEDSHGETKEIYYDYYVESCGVMIFLFIRFGDYNLPSHVKRLRAELKAKLAAEDLCRAQAAAVPGGLVDGMEAETALLLRIFRAGLAAGKALLAQELDVTPIVELFYNYGPYSPDAARWKVFDLSHTATPAEYGQTLDIPARLLFGDPAIPEDDTIPFSVASLRKKLFEDVYSLPVGMYFENV